MTDLFIKPLSFFPSIGSFSGNAHGKRFYVKMNKCHKCGCSRFSIMIFTDKQIDMNLLDFTKNENVTVWFLGE